MVMAPSLEYTILAAILKDQITLQDIDPRSLSHVGQVIYKSLKKLKEADTAWDARGLALMCVEVFGLDKGRYEEYMAHVMKSESHSAAVIHTILQERSALIQVLNEIQHQFSTGDLDIEKLTPLLTSKRNMKAGQVELVSVSDDLEKGPPEPPTGPPLMTLPKVSAATNGVYGVWVVAGTPGVGKSTWVTQQIAVDVGRTIPVLIYDYENTRNVILYRLVDSVGMEAAKKLGRNLYIRDSLRTLHSDLAKIKPPALLIVDCIQKLGTKGASSDENRATLNTWIQRFNELKKDGYHSILVSEINRQNYTGQPRLDAFKDTGDLEYVADAAWVLQEAQPGNLVRLYLVKNRHYPQDGEITLMERTRSYIFSEVNLDAQL